MIYRSPRERHFEVRARALRFSRDEGRLRIACAALLAFAGLLIVRLFVLQVLDRNLYRALASEQRGIYRDLYPERGEILMQDGKGGGLTPLATNKDLYLVYADPRLIENPNKVADMLAPVLGIAQNAECGIGNAECNSEREVDEYQELLDHLSKANDPYEPLKHGIGEDAVHAVEALGIVGIDAVREPTRYYPLKNIGAHLSGFLGSDGNTIAGRYGIEGAFDSELAGTPGFFEGEEDVAGRWIPVGRRKLKPAVNGDSIILTIDRAIEYFACNKLNEAVLRHGASGGTVLISEVKTGAILALCGAPDFDPNEYGTVENISVYNNPATFFQYEPG